MIHSVVESFSRDESGQIEPGSEISFENSRNKARFIAFAGERLGNWIVTRQGGPLTPGVYTPETWGFIQEDDDSWIAYAGNLPDTQGQRCTTRNEALDRVTNMPEGKQASDAD